MRTFSLDVRPIHSYLGRVPAEARPYVYGGRLVAHAKPGGGAHRPLGADVAWWRVAMGYMMHVIGKSAGGVLVPTPAWCWRLGVSRGPDGGRSGDICHGHAGCATGASDLGCVQGGLPKTRLTSAPVSCFLYVRRCALPVIGVGAIDRLRCPCVCYGTRPTGLGEVLITPGMHAGLPCGPALLCCSSAALCASPGTLGSSAVSHYRVA